MKYINTSIRILVLVVFLASTLSAQTIKAPKRPKAPKPPKVEVPAPPEPPAPPVLQEEIFKVVEEMPRFPGCEDMVGTKEEIKACAKAKLSEYVGTRLNYPQEARKNGIEGTVLIQYVVSAEGQVEQLEILRDLGGGCGAAGLAVFEKMKAEGIHWIPGKQRGKAVPVQLILPIKFAL